MKLFTFIFFQFKNYYTQSWEAILAFVAMIMINELSLIFIFASIFDFDPGFYRSDNYFIGRFIKVPLIIILPICLTMLIIYKVNKGKIEKYFDEFRINRNKKLKKRMVLYFLFSGLFFLFSIVSSKIL